MNIVSNIMPSLDKAIIMENLQRIDNLNRKWANDYNVKINSFISYLYENTNIAQVCTMFILNRLYCHRANDAYRLLRDGENFAFNKEDMVSEFWTAFCKNFQYFNCGFNYDFLMTDVNAFYAVYYDDINKEFRARLYSAVSTAMASQNKSIVLKHLYLEDTTIDKEGNEVSNYIRVDDVHGLANSSLILDNIESLTLYDKFMKELKKSHMTEDGKKNTELVLQFRYCGYTYEEIAQAMNLHVNSVYRYGQEIKKIAGRAVR